MIFIINKDSIVLNLYFIFLHYREKEKIKAYPGRVHTI